MSTPDNTDQARPLEEFSMKELIDEVQRRFDYENRHGNDSYQLHSDICQIWKMTIPRGFLFWKREKK